MTSKLYIGIAVIATGKKMISDLAEEEWNLEVVLFSLLIVLDLWLVSHLAVDDEAKKSLTRTFIFTKKINKTTLVKKYSLGI